MLCDPRPRKLGRISGVAEDWIAAASDGEYADLLGTLDLLESGRQEDWDRLPQTELLGTSQFGRLVILMPNGQLVVWRCYVDHPDLYAIYYIGPGHHFVG